MVCLIEAAMLIRKTAAIVDVSREIKGDVAPAWSGMKKTELAAIAEREVRGNRMAAYVAPCPANPTAFRNLVGMV
jgi:hypothetical protein